ncbi:Chordin-like protein 2 [Liparis tanakae]|uniref:Chordin-like protein 2 n=1 Tax=Liparis tanakae TaxID=230148 RepID=A0A4Z2F8L4_9TELE|nr:Chordin-like protein 2 [Liparis tanakae]
MKPTCFFFLIIWVTGTELKPRKGPGVVCTFKDQTYSPGDSWHPYLEPFGLMFCMRCRCSEPRVPAGLRASAKSCRHNGSVYQPGEGFTKLDLFPARRSDQCVLCTCSNGNIFCGLKTCQPISCPSPVAVQETCCLVCKDHGTSGSSSTEDGNQQLNRGARHSVERCSGEPSRPRSDRASPLRARASPRGPSLGHLNLRGASETTVKIVLQRRQRRGCLYNGRTYSHGDAWHPVLGKVLECILCTCTDGLQDCKRTTCPRQYPCQQPVKTAGKCCKQCPGSRAGGNQTRCGGGYKNSLSGHRVDSPLKDDPANAVRTVAVERRGAAEVEVWKAVGGTATPGGKHDQ